MHPRVAASTLCFMGESIDDIAEHWRALAPQRVSVMGHQLEGEALARTRQVIERGGYQVETVSHAFLFGPLSEKSERERAARSLSGLLGAAETVGARSIYMITGGRGSMTWELAAEAFAEALVPCRAIARDAGVELLIEPAPSVYADVHLAHSLRDALKLAELADIGLCVDVFCCWTEAGLMETLAEAAPRIGLVQVGDYVLGDRSLPARAVVGEGAIPIQPICDAILQAGYMGGFDLELLGPRIEQVGRREAVRRSAEKMGEFLQALDA
jgi:sugar phosphate isomerase/epimerase